MHLWDVTICDKLSTIIKAESREEAVVIATEVAALRCPETLIEEDETKAGAAV